MPIVSLENLLRCLELEELEDGAYRGPNLEMSYSRVFGGQLLAQAIVAAARDAAGKTVKSLHAVFPREGDLAKPVLFRLARPHDGRSFATRQITAEQEGRVILSATASLHVPEPGLEHQLPAPEVGPPRDAPAVDLSMIPLETRMVDGVDLSDPREGPAQLAFWLRSPAPLADDDSLHQGILAHCTDLTLIGTTLRPVPGLSQADSPEKIHTAVTSHTLWFHAPFRIDRWLLVSQESPRLAGARGLGLGHVFTEQGVLVASFAQESMIRPRS